MPADEALLAVVSEWIYRAEGDLKNATHVLMLRRQCPTETVAFHAQQCVEKYIKAALTFYEIEFPKVHDIEKLVRLLPPDALAVFPVTEQRTLTSTLSQLGTQAISIRSRLMKRDSPYESRDGFARNFANYFQKRFF